MTPSPASPEAPPSDAALFEVSWEVCNHIGGIYQVLRTKSATMVRRWGARYVLVGPHLPEMAGIEFEPEPASDWLEDVVKDLSSQGVGVHHGRWLVRGKPRVLLLDHHVDPDRLPELRERLEREHAVPPSPENALVDDVLVFGWNVERLLLAVAARATAGEGRRPDAPARLVAHFHEWLGSAALPPLRHSGAPIELIFTTHATSVGRYVASSGEDLYAELSTLDGDLRARDFGILTQHRVEAACARECRLLTTVSPITGEECEQLLGRAPDLVTPNGLNMELFDVGHDFQTLHAQNKDEIHRFVMGHFFPSYAFDLDRTLLLFTAGRYEPANKGFDLCLDAMGRLNARLREADSDVTVIFFIVTNRSTRSLDPHPLRARGLLDDLHEVSHRIGRDLAERLFRRSAAGEVVRLDDLVDEYWRLRHRRIMHALRSDGLPPLSTHVIDDAEEDPILAQLGQLGLRNAREDRVKVVYHPEFISPVSPLWGMDYDQFVRGCHLGIFPSSYEPWGYTPLECVAMGVPAVTSDSAGFGRYVAGAFSDHDDWGLVVLRRRDRDVGEVADELAERLLDFCRRGRRERIALRNAVEAHSRAFDWSSLAAAYHEAHDRVLARSGSATG